MTDIPKSERHPVSIIISETDWKIYKASGLKLVDIFKLGLANIPGKPTDQARNPSQ